MQTAKGQIKLNMCFLLKNKSESAWWSLRDWWGLTKQLPGQGHWVVTDKAYDNDYETWVCNDEAEQMTD